MFKDFTDLENYLPAPITAIFKPQTGKVYFQGGVIDVKYYDDVAVLAEDDFTPVILLVPDGAGFRQSRTFNRASVDRYLDRLSEEFMQARKDERKMKHRERKQAEFDAANEAWRQYFEANPEDANLPLDELYAKVSGKAPGSEKPSLNTPVPVTGSTQANAGQSAASEDDNLPRRWRNRRTSWAR